MQTEAPFDLASRQQSIRSAYRTIGMERDGLSALVVEMANGRLGAAFSKVVDLISKSPGRVIVTGMGKSGHVARKIAATLSSTGTPAYFVHPGEASHGDLGMILPQDTILALSWSGETTELANVVAYAKRHRVLLVAITSAEASTLATAADYCLRLPRAKEACPNGLAPTTSTMLQMSLGDALAVALLQSRGFSADDFSSFHPGGRLGASLRKVSEVMHAGERMPVVTADTSIIDAVRELDRRGLGSVVIVDAEGGLVGILTDGDLRRSMLNTVFVRPLDQYPVSILMSRNPRTVGPDTLLAKALEIQDTYAITSLVVVEGGKPVGLVHYHDLLREGVA